MCFLFRFCLATVSLSRRIFKRFFERSTLHLPLSLFLSRLTPARSARRLVNAYAPRPLSCSARRHTRACARVGVRRAAGAGPQFSRNDQQKCRSLITRACLPIVRRRVENSFDCDTISANRVMNNSFGKQLLLLHP